MSFSRSDLICSRITQQLTVAASEQTHAWWSPMKKEIKGILHWHKFNFCLAA
jgi:hypothetical protein